MDATELAVNMLKWERLARKMDALATEIKVAVLDIGKTQTVGNVRASYNKGRTRYDYQAAADGHKMVSEATVSVFTTIVPQTKKVDWRSICMHVGIMDIPFTQAEPSVTIKLLA